MREQVGDIWEVACAARCITTNGELMSDKLTAVMGRGVALQAKQRYPWIPAQLGNLLKAHGNHVYDLGEWEGVRLIAFPTKYYWRESSDVRLIRQSCKELRSLIFPETGLLDGMPRPRDFPKLTGVVAMTRPGCGNGNLSWEQIKPILEQELPEDNFVVLQPPSS